MSSIKVDELRDNLWEFFCNSIDLFRRMRVVSDQLHDEYRKKLWNLDQEKGTSHCAEIFECEEGFEPVDSRVSRHLTEELTRFWESYSKVIPSLTGFHGNQLQLVQAAFGLGWKLRVTQTIDQLTDFLRFTAPAPRFGRAADAQEVVHLLRNHPVPEWSVQLSDLQKYVEELRHLQTSQEEAVPECTLTVSEAAKIARVVDGVISRAVSTGAIKSNGKQGRERRIDPASLSIWIKDHALSQKKGTDRETSSRSSRRKRYSNL